MPYEFTINMKQIIDEVEAERRRKGPEREQVKLKLKTAIQQLLKNDSILLENDVNERSITHKLAEYLQIEFSEYNVDCEYNKNGDVTKELDGLKRQLESVHECVKHIATDRVLPDIIVHKRKIQKDNLLVIEVKKRINPTSSKCDEKKLELFTQEGHYHYSYGVFIRFNRLEEPDCIWFEEGKRLNHN